MIYNILKESLVICWNVFPITRPNTKLKCNWPLFSKADYNPSISLAPRMLNGQCPIDRAEKGGKGGREKSRANEIREG